MKRQIAGRLGLENAAPHNESVYDRVNRAKHRWLKRVMFDCGTNSSEKCFAYLVLDRLNCVTLDCWPSQKLIAEQFGWSIKTVHRVAIGLKRRGHLLISRNTRGSCRYAPVFLPEDEDKSVANARHNCPSAPDKNVEESFLGIQISKSSPSRACEASESLGGVAWNYRPRQRGAYEAEVAKLLGNEGFEILERLSELDDGIVERLCRAFANGELGGRELIAARLAANQLPRKRSPM
ncbi:hypothetical protein [Bradyrhizobium sp.]|uniref:hypothetical protein n=1 Tax=Bradyrhizobium sp. TaxID=376 RepID=UPI003C3BCDE9